MPPLTKRNHDIRSGNVGASEVAALLDCGHPYRTPADLYASIVHGVNTFRGNANAAQMGHELEDVVLRMGSDRMDVKVRRNNRTRKHPTLPLAVTCDAYVWGSGNRIPVEIKTAGAWAAEEWADGNVPAHYLAQVQAQLMVTGGEYGHLWALLGGRDFHGRTIDADLDHPVWGQRVIAERIERFYNSHIIPRIPPVDTPTDLLFVFDIPEGVAAADGDLETVGQMVADLMQTQDYVKESLEQAREGLFKAMAERRLRLVTAENWTAEAKTNPSGSVSLRFTRKRN